MLYPGPPEAARASSPMKKSRSSVPRLPAKFELGPAPPVRYEGLLAGAGLPEPAPAAPPPGPFIAIAVGNTHEGASFPANPNRREVRKVKPTKRGGRTKFREASTTGTKLAQGSSIHNVGLLVHDNGRRLRRHAADR